MPVIQLTQSFINNLAPLPGKTRTEWCDENIPGLYIEARATSLGKGTYYLRHRGAKSGGGGIATTTRHLKLGVSDNMSLADARSEAKKRKAEIQLGADPRADIRAQKSSITYGQYLELHYLPHSKQTKKSHRDDYNRSHQHLIPRWGSIPINQITTRMIIELQHDLKDSGLASSTCDRFVALLKHQFRLACEWEFLSKNAASTVKLYREPNEVNHYLDDAQLRRLMEVLHTHENRLVCNLAIFLLSTAARLNEALRSEWQSVDVEKRLWRIEASNSKNKRVRAVPLNDMAISALESIQADHAKRCGYLFLNPKTNTHLKYPGKGWNSIRQQAGLPFFRIHDLRHMAASIAVNSGRSLYEVQKLLGHSQVQTSLRYSHLSTQVLQEASNTVSDRLIAASPRQTPSLQLVKTGS
jgi:integrase